MLIFVRSSSRLKNLFLKAASNQVGLCREMLLKRCFAHSKVIREIIHGDRSDTEREKLPPSLGNDALPGGIIHSRSVRPSPLAKDRYPLDHLLESHQNASALRKRIECIEFPYLKPALFAPVGTPVTRHTQISVRADFSHMAPTSGP